MKAATSKFALVALLGAAVVTPALAQSTTPSAPATPPTSTMTPPATETAPTAQSEVKVSGTVAEVAGDAKSYSVEVPTQSGKKRPIAVDASAVTSTETFAVGDKVTVIGTLDEDQTKLTASSITKAPAAGE